MRLKSIVTAAIAAGFIGLAGSAASAAPLGTGVADVKSAANQTSSTEAVVWRCWWHRGFRHCGHVAPFYGLYFGPRFRRW